MRHWSIYNGNSRVGERKFQREIESIVLPAAGSATQRYTVLPNFWDGYRHQAHQSDPNLPLESGSLSIRRVSAGPGLINNTVDYDNSISGEALHLEYACQDTPLRNLAGEWQLNTHNRTIDAYSGYSRRGTFEPGDIPMMCNWSLFDALPLPGDYLNREFIIFDDLEKRQRGCRVLSLPDQWELRVSGGILHLNGYYIRGKGHVPTYWWVEENSGQVIIMSNVFLSFIVKGERNA